MPGLQSVTLGNTMCFDVELGEFVQILHNGQGHWLTVSSVGRSHGQIEVYDSAYSSCSSSSKAQIAALLATQLPSIELKYMDTQMQSGSSDCGLFAVAFATAIVFGKQPGLFSFDQSQMREHLKKCLEQQCITMFPIKKSRRRTKVKATEQVHVYCSCRMPELSGTEWIECSKCREWYHAGACVEVEQRHFDVKCKWFCPGCRNL